jgi:hypothetical protein
MNYEWMWLWWGVGAGGGGLVGVSREMRTSRQKEREAKFSLHSAALSTHFVNTVVILDFSSFL